MNWDFNQDKIEVYDVVPMFIREIEAISKSKRPKTKDELDEMLDQEAMYHFWSKCEYEILIRDWPSGKEEEKIDVYDQLKMNWNNFVDFFWEKVYRPNYLKSRKSKA